MGKLKPYIYQRKHWPEFTWDINALLPLLGQVRHHMGKLSGKMEALGFAIRNEAALETMTLDVLKSSEIEGEIFNAGQVRSSIARHLGMHIPGMVDSDRHVEGMVEMMLDATRQYHKPLSAERLFKWHHGLFPDGGAYAYKVRTGEWRKDETGPMQVVSGAMGKERVHFEAPVAELIEKEMQAFIQWFNLTEEADPVIKAAIAHLWFVTLHPFDDGNGRIARAISDMQLARADGIQQRFYSMSARIRLERNKYYDILEQTQKGQMDITAWIRWFLECLFRTLTSSEKILARVLAKALFWETHKTTAMNGRQLKMLNKLLDGFDGKLTSSKWAKINKSSADTALRDIQDLVDKDILRKEAAGGRSTNYELNI